MILLIDNYDSFVWNLDHALRLASRDLGAERDVLVVRNDAIDPARVRDLAPSHIVLSPGPCGPHEAGACLDLVRAFAGEIPILGVCLGHQVIAEAFGMRVVRAAEPVHGKPAIIKHDGAALFERVPSPFRAARYHSLVVPEEDVAAAHDPRGRWEVSARTPDGVVMGIRRLWRDSQRAPVEGVQFHPESYLTEHGVPMLANFLRAVRGPAPAPERAPSLAAADTIAAR